LAGDGARGNDVVVEAECLLTANPSFANDVL
jgi:hypothetical protein